MNVVVDDTIVAIASAPGGAMRGIVRLSGQAVVGCLDKIFKCQPDGSLQTVRRPRMISGAISVPDPIKTVPGDLYLWPTERSYTRQPAAEFHTYGAAPLLDAVVQGCCQAGARLAQPGEFTLRAFLAGRIDLTQAEAVLGVIDANDRQELDVALTQLSGGLASPLSRLRHDLMELLAHLEAGLDFVEEDIEFISQNQLLDQLGRAVQGIEALVEQLSQRTESTHQRKVVLVGWPNVGKSSLMNALAGQPISLVSQQVGTTRDYVTQSITVGEVSCLLVDTAGVDRLVSDATIEHAAQDFMSEQLRQAHLELLCLDASRPLNEWEEQQLARKVSDRLIVLTKVDEARAVELGRAAIETSSRTGEGIEQLKRAMADNLKASDPFRQVVVTSTANRCRESLAGALQNLHRAIELVTQQLGEELIAWEVREALDHLGKVVGAVYTDDILDRVFSRFCIGK